ncbi:hypothetical protein [Arthrobacter sp. ISL-69]|uniref:hypothetical protein n=1 Tax=Arthrobacter sp. ISL-69 TaxID=2819113 RepID=UPI001BE72229|nr:hypothetical protein [Arthrobacter sp. ISL-69]MBT2538684.1 hypothetical protein [Arthrobacter sp. ISL-69]
MARNITDQDIVEALNGTPARSARTNDRDVVEVLRTGTTSVKRNMDTAIVEALHGNPTGHIAAEGELPLQRRGDDIEAVAIWASKEAASTATSALAQALMRADGSKGIYAAESEARAIAAEAYAEVAKTSPYEDHRQEAVKRAVTKMADIVTRDRSRESRATPAAMKPANVAEAKPTLTPRVTTSKMTGQPITHYS